MKTKMEHRCDQALEALVTALERDDFSSEQLEALVSRYPGCSADLRSTFKAWQGMEALEVPEPSAEMHAGFYRMLHACEREELRSTRSFFSLPWKTGNSRSASWALLAAVFVLGLCCGWLFLPASSGVMITEASDDRRQPSDSYTLLTSSASATDRLQALQMTRELAQLDDRIVEALNQTLLHDSNVNVRLSAIETMLHFADHPKVRENLIRAIPHQTSPLIQMTLAEVMIALNDKRAVEEIRALIEQQQLELEVQMKMKATIEVLM